MLSALIYFFACFGLSWILSEASISYGVRSYFYLKSENSKVFNFLFNLSNCIICTSWWVGAFTLLTPYPYELFKYEHWFMYAYLPFAVAGLTVWWVEFTEGFDSE